MNFVREDKRAVSGGQSFTSLVGGNIQLSLHDTNKLRVAMEMTYEVYACVQPYVVVIFYAEVFLLVEHCFAAFPLIITLLSRLL